MSRITIQTADWLRWNPLARGALSGYELLRVSLARPRNSREAAKLIDRACAAARLAPRSSWLPAIEERIHRLTAALDASELDWPSLVADAQRPRLEKAVLLKPRISPREKGVLFVSFENQWARLARGCDLKQLAASYWLVVAPTWSPPHGLVTCLFPLLYPGPIFCLMSGADDAKIFPRLSNRYRVLPLYASSWINPTHCNPLPRGQRDVDIFMVANFGQFKRHFLLFQALRRMPKSLRVLLIGQTSGSRTRDSILGEARSYGVADRFELRVSVPQSQVLEALCRSKISLVLSRREGSCVAVSESLMANAPVGMFEDAEIGSRAFINAATGRFLNRKNLAGQLMDFLERSGDYAPREWAEPRISCFRSSQILNDQLKAHALEAGEEWTRDIAALQWRPDPELVFPADQARLESGRKEFREQFGMELGPVRT